MRKVNLKASLPGGKAALYCASRIDESRDSCGDDSHFFTVRIEYELNDVVRNVNTWPPR